MILMDRLEGAIREAGYRSKAEAGKAVGIAPATFYRKMQSGEFSMREVDDMIEAYQIRHPEEIFILGRNNAGF